MGDFRGNAGNGEVTDPEGDNGTGVGAPTASAMRRTLARARDGKTLDQSNWTIAWVDSEEADKEDGGALNAINGQNSDYWITADKGGGHPHRLVIDLGTRVDVAGLRYVPRQGAEGVTGRIRRYRAYVGDALVTD